MWLKIKMAGMGRVGTVQSESVGQWPRSPEPPTSQPGPSCSHISPSEIVLLPNVGHQQRSQKRAYNGFNQYPCP